MRSKLKEKTQFIRDYRDQSNNEKSLWLGYFSLIIGVFLYTTYHEFVVGQSMYGLDLIVVLSLFIYAISLAYYKEE